MHCIFFYDVNVKRVARFHKAMLRKMFWLQNSTFEGELSCGEQTALRRDITRMLNPEEDRVVMIWTPVSEAWRKTHIGIEKGKMELIAWG